MDWRTEKKDHKELNFQNQNRMLKNKMLSQDQIKTGGRSHAALLRRSYAKAMPWSGHRKIIL